MKEISVNSLDQLSDVAREVISSLDGRTVVLLYAPMGGGKTTLVSAIASYLGSQDSVSSPTFAIVNEYEVESGESIYHFDMYRIESLHEAIDLGFDEYIHSGRLCFIEWAERVEPLLPDDAMLVRIEVKYESQRTFYID